ncbi:MAG: bifunctional oligoribonuclease/PAP phosphatase NrnA [candidate division Zixibacteria bacterium]|nr:bifunctional oligoribonuclease/PAP phosphatase NrnA [candidate division Zixibacteria bacterium]
MSTKIQKTYNDIQKAVADSKSVLIFSHSAPDGDSIGSQLAFRNYILNQGKSVEIINDGPVPNMYKKLPDTEAVMDLVKTSALNRFDLLVVLDCSNLERIGKVKELIKYSIPIINIDHHPDNNGFGTINLVSATSSSTAEILTEYFVGINHIIDKKTATQLYAAIITDTGRFRYESTSRRTMELVGILIESGAKPRDICDNIYYSLSPSKLRITGKMLETAMFFEDGKICMMEVSQDNIKKYNATLNDFNGLAEFTLHAEGTVVGALLEEHENNNVKVSLRSKSDINVSEVAHAFGGGGHFNASGCIIKSSLKTSRDRLLDNLKGLVNASV